MHLAKNAFLKTSSECLIYFLLISFPASRRHGVASQTASVAADDRLMKRVQSQPAGWFCTCSRKRSVMSGWFRRAGGQRDARPVIYGHAQMGGGDPGGAGVTYSAERNMILDNCKHSRATWTGRSNTDAFHSHLPCWWLLMLYNEHTSGWFQWHLEG